MFEVNACLLVIYKYWMLKMSVNVFFKNNT